MANHPVEGQMVMLNVRIATPPPTERGGIAKYTLPPGVASTYF